MKYYKIEFSLDTKEIGDYPQIQKFKKGYDPNKRESCSQLSRYYFGIKPDVVVDFDGLALSNKAKLTDYLSTSYLNELTGLLVSSSLYNYLLKLRIPEQISYQTYLYKKDMLISNNYLWVHFIKNYPELIDYSKSQFFLDHSEANYKKVTVSSFSEYEKLQNEVQYHVNAKQLVLKKEFANKFDVLRLGAVLSEVFVTETVRDEMINQGFTGITYELADYLIVE